MSLGKSVLSLVVAIASWFNAITYIAFYQIFTLPTVTVGN